MTHRRRLDRLEASLGPTAAVCLWLAEAQAFGSLPTYVAWLSTQPKAAGPFLRIRDQVRADAERQTRGQPRASIEQAAAIAIRAAFFRIGLVLELNVWTGTELQLAALRHDLLYYMINFLLVEGDRSEPTGTTGGPDPAGLDRLWARLPGAVAVHATGILAAEEAATSLERRFLGGHPALFPDFAAERQRLVADVPLLLDGVRSIAPGGPADPGAGNDVSRSVLEPAALRSAVAGRAAVHAAARVAEARVKAYELLGEQRQADILGGRLYRRTLRGPSSDSLSRGSLPLTKAT